MHHPQRQSLEAWSSLPLSLSASYDIFLSILLQVSDTVSIDPFLRPGSSNLSTLFPSAREIPWPDSECHKLGMEKHTCIKWVSEMC
jgi:hypothetical protein